jgi:hypothetical protein
MRDDPELRVRVLEEIDALLAEAVVLESRLVGAG